MPKYQHSLPATLVQQITWTTFQTSFKKKFAFPVYYFKVTFITENYFLLFFHKAFLSLHQLNLGSLSLTIIISFVMDTNVLYTTKIYSNIESKTFLIVSEETFFSLDESFGKFTIT